MSRANKSAPDRDDALWYIVELSRYAEALACVGEGLIIARGEALSQQQVRDLGFVFELIGKFTSDVQALADGNYSLGATAPSKWPPCFTAPAAAASGDNTVP